MIIERERGFLIFLFCAPFLKESDVRPYIAFFIVARGILFVRPFCRPRLGAGSVFTEPADFLLLRKYLQRKSQ